MLNCKKLILKGPINKELITDFLKALPEVPDHVEEIEVRINPRPDLDHKKCGYGHLFITATKTDGAYDLASPLAKDGIHLIGMDGLKFRLTDAEEELAELIR